MGCLLKMRLLSIIVSEGDQIKTGTQQLAPSWRSACKIWNWGSVTEIERRRCPYCKLAEDFTHVLTCADPRALQSRSAARTTLQKVLPASGAGGYAVIRAITAWTLNPLVPLSLIVPDVRIQHVLTSQTQIGWVHLFRGFLSRELATVLVKTTATTSDARRSQSITMASATIMAIQDYTLAIWGSRNEVLHEADSESLDIVHAALNDPISQLYSLQTSFSPLLQSYFTLPLEARLKLPPRQRQRWLRLARLATSLSSATGTRQQLLSTYFPHVNAAPADLSDMSMRWLLHFRPLLKSYIDFPSNLFFANPEEHELL